jgi:hypothetical protein
MGPTVGRSILSSGPARACWRHSRGIQRRPAGGGSLVSGARQRPLTQVYEQGQGPLPACIPARSNFYLASCHTSTWISTGCGTLDTCFGEQSSYTRPHNACIPSLSHAGKACHRVGSEVLRVAHDFSPEWRIFFILSSGIFFLGREHATAPLLQAHKGLPCSKDSFEYGSPSLRH